MTIQVNRRPDGGYAVHKITLPKRLSTYSAYFDNRGQLIDAGRRDDRGVEYPIARDGLAWQELERNYSYLHDLVD
jgi:hypothetical protein